MKEMNMSVEHVQEYVKSWAWEGREVGQFDQLYLFAKQARREYILLNKVDHIITDSPVFLSAFYEQKYYDHFIVKNSIPEYIEAVKQTGGRYLNFMLRRNKPYNPKGRYQTEEESRQIDKEMRNWMNENGYPYVEIDSYEEIFNHLGDKNEL